MSSSTSTSASTNAKKKETTTTNPIMSIDECLQGEETVVQVVPSSSEEEEENKSTTTTVTNISLPTLRRIASVGICDSSSQRGLAWRILLGYLPVDDIITTWSSVLQQQRQTYVDLVQDVFYYDTDSETTAAEWMKGHELMGNVVRNKRNKRQQQQQTDTNSSSSSNRTAHPQFKEKKAENGHDDESPQQQQEQPKQQQQDMTTTTTTAITTNNANSHHNDDEQNKNINDNDNEKTNDKNMSTPQRSQRQRQRQWIPSNIRKEWKRSGRDSKILDQFTVGGGSSTSAEDVTPNATRDAGHHNHNHHAHIHHNHSYLLHGYNTLWVVNNDGKPIDYDMDRDMDDGMTIAIAASEDEDPNDNDDETNDNNHDNDDVNDNNNNVNDDDQWNTFLQRVTLLDEIRKDVVRTHPDLKFFLEGPSLGERRYAAMERILFIWANQHTSVRYVQGMNEIVGTLYFVLANDVHVEWAAHAEADTYHLFSILMEEMKDIFVPAMDHEDTGIQGRINNMNALLQLHDPEVASHLEDVGIHASFYAIRWLTTLLSREFLLPDTIRLWDSMFASTHKDNFLRYVCVTMVMVIRNDLLKSDFSSCLYLLQSYPPPPHSLDALLESSRALWIYESQITLACHKGGISLSQALCTISPPPAVIMAYGLVGGVAVVRRSAAANASSTSGGATTRTTCTAVAGSIAALGATSTTTSTTGMKSDKQGTDGGAASLSSLSVSTSASVAQGRAFLHGAKDFLGGLGREAARRRNDWTTANAAAATDRSNSDNKGNNNNRSTKE